MVRGSRPWFSSRAAAVCMRERPNWKDTVSVSRPAYSACAISRVSLMPHTSKKSSSTIVDDSESSSTMFTVP